MFPRIVPKRTAPRFRPRAVSCGIEKQFGSDDQIGNHRFFDDAPAILERVAIKKDIQCHCALEHLGKGHSQISRPPARRKSKNFPNIPDEPSRDPSHPSDHDYAYQKSGFGIVKTLPA
jgi:hypothetical protein